MSQATLAYTLQRAGQGLRRLANGTPHQIKEKNYLAAPLKFVNMMNRGIPDYGADPMPETFPGKYRAMWALSSPTTSPTRRRTNPAM